MNDGVIVGLLADLGGVSTVAFEHPGGCKFAKLVSDHVFRYINADKVFTVVNVERMTDEVRNDHAAAGPCLDRALDGLLIHLVDLDEELLLNEGTFFEGSAHNIS